MKYDINQINSISFPHSILGIRINSRNYRILNAENALHLNAMSILKYAHAFNMHKTYINEMQITIHSEIIVRIMCSF